MSAPLRVGIVGSGAMSAYHAKRFSKIEGLRVTATADRDPGRAAAFARENGIARAFPDVDRLCASGEVDAIAIGSRDAWHRDPAMVAFSRGLPVFCEKPLARTGPDAREMSGTAELKKIPAIVNFSKRNGGTLSLARTLVAAGSLGKLTAAEGSYLQSWLLHGNWGDYRRSPRWQWRLDDSQSTFGVIGDLGSHLFDALLLILGDGGPSACQGRRFEVTEPSPWLTGPPAYESFDAFLSFGGVATTASASYRARGCLDAFTLRLRGELADAEIGFGNSRDSLVLVDGPEGLRREIKAPPVPSTYERFAALAKGGLDPLPDEPLDFARALEVQSLIAGTAVLASAREP